MKRTACSPAKVETLELNDRQTNPQENAEAANDTANQPLLEKVAHQFQAALPLAPTAIAR